MKPILFKKYLVDKVWGGRNFQDYLQIPLPDNKLYGESWEISGNAAHISIADSGEFPGTDINTLIKEYGDTLLGNGLSEKFSHEFPILVKYLDINDRLSIQVHPDDSYALKNENSRGKFESWYVINASSDAQMILGLKEGVKKEELPENIKSRPIDETFNIVNLKPGDFLNITPGTVHATIKGSILICEIQQSSDTTYRIFDYDRTYNNKKRPLHIEKGLEVIRENSRPEIINTFTNNEEINDSKIIPLAKTIYYSIDKLIINGIYNDKIYRNFKILSAISGAGKIICSDEVYDFKSGMTYFIPANLKISLKGKLEILKSYI